MNASIRPECFGGILPDLSALRFNAPTEGKALRVFVEKIGCGVQRREIQVDQAAWVACETCPRFEGCYRLSIARTLLWLGISS